MIDGRSKRVDSQMPPLYIGVFNSVVDLDNSSCTQIALQFQFQFVDQYDAWMICCCCAIIKRADIKAFLAKNAGSFLGFVFVTKMTCAP